MEVASSGDHGHSINPKPIDGQAVVTRAPRLRTDRRPGDLVGHQIRFVPLAVRRARPSESGAVREPWPRARRVDGVQVTIDFALMSRRVRDVPVEAARMRVLDVQSCGPVIPHVRPQDDAAAVRP